MPVVTGRALEAYRRHERPKTSDVAVFVRRWRGMNARISLLARVEQYRAERRQLGFKLRSMGHGLPSFARYVAEVGHHGPLTVDLMADWARQAKAGRSDRATLARRLKMPRPFTAWLRQFDTATEVPDEAVFGRVPGRMTPHVYREPKIVELLAAAR